MIGFIDIKTLVAEIEGRIKELKKEYIRTASLRCDGGMVELYKLRSFIYSLQQGPAEDTGITDVDKAAKVYAKGEYSRKNPSTLPDRCRGCYAPIEYAFKAGARWMKEKKEE